MNWDLFAVIVELICFIILDVVIFKLRRELKSARESAKDSEDRAERYYNKAEKLQSILDADRVPSQYCEGCRYLIKDEQGNPFLGGYRGIHYGCRKNIRCKEYEDEEDVH